MKYKKLLNKSKINEETNKLKKKKKTPHQISRYRE